jgi:hypothetical protein
MPAIPRSCKTFSLIALFTVLPFTATAQSAGKLKTEINPGRTGIFVDGKYLGPAANFKIARTYSLPAGEHEVLLTEPRFKDHTTKVTIESGKTFKLKYAMEPLPAPKGPFGRLRIAAGNLDKFTPIYINGKYMGHIDEFSNSEQGLLINPADYEVKIGDKVEKVTIKENQVTTLHP